MSDDLTDTKNRCVLVGDLSDRDADQYLRDRLVRDGKPAIPESIRTKIVSASAGWPLYLDIAAGQYQQALQEGTVDSVDFGAPFLALVTRLTSDLSPEERRVVRGASLFTSFDEALVHAAAGDVSRASVKRVLARSFVKYDSSPLWPYSLHPALRAALTVDDQHEDSWAPSDWSAAVSRILTEMGHRADRTENRVELAARVDQGLRMAHAYDLSADWLSKAGRRLASKCGLSSIHYLGSSNTYAGALSRVLECVGARYELPFLRQAESLGKCLTPKLMNVDRFWARSLQADALLSAGDLGQAESIYREILRDPVDGDLVAETKTMYAVILLIRGAFVDVEQYAHENADQVDNFRLLGDVYRWSAQWGRAHEQHRAGLTRAADRGDVGLANLFRAELALVDGWVGANNPHRWESDTEDRNEAWVEISRLIADALYVCTRDRSSATRTLEVAQSISDSFGLHQSSSDVIIARAFIASVYDEDDEFSRLATLFEA